MHPFFYVLMYQEVHVIGSMAPAVPADVLYA